MIFKKQQLVVIAAALALPIAVIATTLHATSGQTSVRAPKPLAMGPGPVILTKAITVNVPDSDGNLYTKTKSGTYIKINGFAGAVQSPINNQQSSRVTTGAGVSQCETIQPVQVKLNGKSFTITKQCS